MPYTPPKQLPSRFYKRPLSEEKLKKKLDKILVPVMRYLCEADTGGIYPESLDEFRVGHEAQKKLIKLIEKESRI
jgi:hypothetical protein